MNLHPKCAGKLNGGCGLNALMCLPADSTKRCPGLNLQCHCQHHHSSVTLFFSPRIDVPLSSCARFANCQQPWHCAFQTGNKLSSNEAIPRVSTQVWIIWQDGVEGATLVMLEVLLTLLVSVRCNKQETCNRVQGSHTNYIQRHWAWWRYVFKRRTFISHCVGNTSISNEFTLVGKASRDRPCTQC